MTFFNLFLFFPCNVSNVEYKKYKFLLTKKFQSKPSGLAALVGNKLDGERFVLGSVFDCCGVGTTQPHLDKTVSLLFPEEYFLPVIPCCIS